MTNITYKDTMKIIKGIFLNKKCMYGDREEKMSLMFFFLLSKIESFDLKARKKMMRCFLRRQKEKINSETKSWKKEKNIRKKK